MTAQLTFSLPEEFDELQVSLDAYKWKSIVSDLLQKIKEETKHKDQPEPAAKAFETVKSFIWAEMEALNLSLD